MGHRELWILQNAEDTDIWEKEDDRLVSPSYRSTNYELDGQGPCDVFVHVIEYSAFEDLQAENEALRRQINKITDYSVDPARLLDVDHLEQEIKKLKNKDDGRPVPFKD